MSTGIFIAFEGIEGCGKTTQLARLQARLEGAGRTVRRLREPGGTPLGDRIRDILLDPASQAMTARTEMFLFAASRAQLVREQLRPALAAGEVVLCDRYLYSSLSYQGAGRELGRELVYQVNSPAIDGLLPDRVVLLDLDPETALRRARARAGLDRIEAEAQDFHRRVRAAFLDEAERDPQRFVVLEAGRSPAEVERALVEALGPELLAGGAAA